MSIHESVSIRELQTTDVNFLLSSSLQCLIQYLPSFYRGWDKRTLYKNIEQKIIFALNKLDYSVFIACDAKDSDHIIGYIVATTKSNHILLQYTKYAYRKLGIQKNLLLPLVVDSSKPITYQWGTKEVLKLHSADYNVTVKDYLSEQMIQMILEKEEA